MNRWILSSCALLTLGLASCTAASTDESEVDDEVVDVPVAAAQSELSGHPLGPDPAGSATKYPIVLVHGFTGSHKIWNFVGVPEALTADGHQVYAVELAPFGTPDTNATLLGEQVDALLAKLGAKKVNLVAHSKGGLDARAYASKHPERVASVTTIASPHRGTAIADVALGVVGDGNMDGALDALTTLWTETLSRDDLVSDNDILAALYDMSEANSGAWNAAHPDAKGVYYQSWAGVSNYLGIPGPNDLKDCEGKGYMTGVPRDRMDAKLVPVAAFVAHGWSMRANDGMATVQSSKWGVFQGCIPADHQDDVGRNGQTGADSQSGFDHVRFYRQIAFDLAKKGY